MPQPPLSDAMVATLKSDACAALAAIMIVANAHSELLAWAQRALGGKPPGGRQNAEESGNAGGGNPPPAATLKTRKAPKLDVAAYQARRQARRDADDERLIEAMKQAPGASVREWGSALGKCRTATVQALHRLRDAGRIESDDGNWALVEPRPAASAPPWIAPLSGARVARHAADGRVRGELTMAPSPA